MKLSTSQLITLADIAISAAREAGKMITNFSQKKIKTIKKTGGDTLASQVVTEVDLLSQKIILDKILPTCKKFDIALLTEEQEDDQSRLEKEYFWCIDPLDGTLPFIERTAGYAVSIALVAKDGTPQIGVVYDPTTANLYHAIKGQGAFKNNQALSKTTSMKWFLKDSSSYKTINLITDRSFVAHKNFSEITKKLSSLTENLKITKHGGAVMNAIWVLENPPAIYLKLPKKQQGGGSLWDYAATACIFTELNLHVSDSHGNPVDLNRPDSTFMNHRGILYTTNPKLARRVINDIQRHQELQ